MGAWLANFFANPALLAGASAGSIPIIIHLLNRQRFRRIWWGAMHWLWAAQKKASRRLRIEQLILLLIRVLILVLLAFALARPALHEGMGMLSGRPHAYRVIVIDNSYSMGYSVGGKPLFDKAKEMAVKLVEQLQPGDEVDVLLANDRIEELTPTAALKHSDVIRDIQAARLSDGTTHLPRAIAGACRLIQDRKSKHPRKEIVLITDRTRRSWMEASDTPKKLDSTEQEAVEQVFGDDKGKPRLWVVRLAGEPHPQNAVAVRLDIDEKVVTAGVETQIVAEVQNKGLDPLPGLPVTLFVDGDRIGREEIAKLEPAAREPVVFRHTFPVAGSHALSVEVGLDNLPADNTRFLAVDVEEQVKVLLVDGMQKAEKMESEMDFLRQALLPSRAEEVHAGHMPLFPEVIGDGEFPNKELDDYSLIVLANVALIPKEKIDVLEQWVKRGGSLWIWMGDRIDPRTYNTEMGSLLPAVVGEAVGLGNQEEAVRTNTQERVSDKVVDHPAIRSLANFKKEESSLARMEVYRRFKLEAKPAEGAQAVRTMLALENGDPVALDWNLGEGRVVLMGTSADRDWCNWPTLIQYMPLVNFIALDLIKPGHEARNRAVGEPFVYRIPRQTLGAMRRAGLSLRDPAKEPVQVDVQTETFSAVSKPCTRAGIYTLDLPGETPVSVHFAANRHNEESELDTIDDEELRAFLPASAGAKPERGLLLSAHPLRGDVEFMDENLDEVVASIKKHTSGREIWRWFVMAVVLLLVAESFLAKRFGDFNR